MTNNKNIHLTKKTQGMGMEDIVVLWVLGFCRDSHRFICGYEMGMGIEIQSPRQPCKYLYHLHVIACILS